MWVFHLNSVQFTFEKNFGQSHCVWLKWARYGFISPNEYIENDLNPWIASECVWQKVLHVSFYRYTVLQGNWCFVFVFIIIFMSALAVLSGSWILFYNFPNVKHFFKTIHYKQRWGNERLCFPIQALSSTYSQPNNENEYQHRASTHKTMDVECHRIKKNTKNKQQQREKRHTKTLVNVNVNVNATLSRTLKATRSNIIYVWSPK